MRRIILFSLISISLFLFCYADTSLFAQNAPEEFTGRYTELKSGYFISRSKKVFVASLKLREEDDVSAIDELIDSGDLRYTLPGERVYVINIRRSINAARVKFRDGKHPLWTEIKALGYENRD